MLSHFSFFSIPLAATFSRQQQTAFVDMPNTLVYFGKYGDQLIAPELKAVMGDTNAVYGAVRQAAAF